MLWVVLMACKWFALDCWIYQYRFEVGTANDYASTNPPPSGPIPIVNGCGERGGGMFLVVTPNHPDRDGYV